MEDAVLKNAMLVPLELLIYQSLLSVKSIDSFLDSVFLKGVFTQLRIF
jgi:hypothetical protein